MLFLEEVMPEQSGHSQQVRNQPGRHLGNVGRRQAGPDQNSAGHRGPESWRSGNCRKAQAGRYPIQLPLQTRSSVGLAGSCLRGRDIHCRTQRQ